MARRRHGHKRSKDEVRSLARKALGYVQVGVGVAGFGHGAITSVVNTSKDGQWNALGSRMIYQYTGFDPNNPNAGLNQNQLMTSVGTMAGTAATLWILKWARKQLR